MPNRRGATPETDQLLRVVAVAQTHEWSSGRLTVVSLELYAEAFLVHTHLRCTVERRAANDIDESQAAPAAWLSSTSLAARRSTVQRRWVCTRNASA